MNANLMRGTLTFAAAATLAMSGTATAAVFLGPSPYLSASDSPLASEDLAYFHLENFEDGTLNVPGASASTGGVVAPAAFADSVDGDDGSINGSGSAGHSFTPGASSAIRFTFDANVLGALPTHAGLVWTDVGINPGPYGFGQVSFEAFGPDGATLGTFGPVLLGDGDTNGQTAEDRFFGVVSSAGISAIEMRINSQDWEVDHLQYGRAPADHFQCYKAKDARSTICAAEAASNPGAACTTETDCGGTDGDTTFCGRSTSLRGRSMELADAIETAEFGATKLAAICNPANKNGEGITDDRTRLLAYKLKASGEAAGAQVGIEIVNQFHEADELRVDTVKADRLLVPAALDVDEAVAAPDPASHGVDHYKCYKVKVTKGAAKFARINGVTVADAFTQPAATYDIVKPARLCLPASKTLLPDGEPEPIRNANAALMCYRAKLSKTDPKQGKHVPVLGIYGADQLGVRRMDTKKSEALCVPSSVLLPD